MPPSFNFNIRNCSLAAIATGDTARSLLEFRDKLALVDEGCIYYHFWGGRINPQFVHQQYHNDFASWINYRLNDSILAEKLSIIDPTEFNHLEDLRQQVLETIDKRLDDNEIVLWTNKEDQFHFIRSTTIIFKSNCNISRPEELSTVVPKLPPSSIFFHFIDARSRTENKRDDFSAWLALFGDQYSELIDQIQMIDPYFLSLTELRDELSAVIRNYFEKRRA